MPVRSRMRALGAAAATTAVVTAGLVAAAPTTADPAAPDFGPNVTVFDPSWAVDDINAALAAGAHEGEFSQNRHAYFFLPGEYGSAAGAADPATATGIVNAQIGYYQTVAGLGASPDDVLINGALHAEGRTPATGCPWWGEGDTALINFWRSMSNLAINPIQRPVAADTGVLTGCTDGPTLVAQEGIADPHQLRWAVSQAAPLRRVHVQGSLTFMPRFGGYSSGGYLADSKVDGLVTSGSQQQWYTRDSEIGSWSNGVWNQVFSGVVGAPATDFGAGVYTTLPTTPVSRPAPFLYVDGGGEYAVFVPHATTDASGVDWSTDAAHGTSIGIDDFYLAHEGDTAATINAQLATGKHLLLTPGVYHLESALHVTRADTVVLGIGMASLTPDNGTAAIEVDDVTGVKIAGITVDAGVVASPVLVKVGPTGATASDASDPTTLSDVFIRVGGPWAGNATTSIEVNSDHVLLDHIWAWRGDHGVGGTGTWTGSVGDHGLIVNGDSVTATGLFVEHYQRNQVIWNGEDGTTVFYQSEIPYEVPDQASWRDGARDGYASYRVADTVTRHAAYGLGVYSFFNQGADVWLESGVQAPRSREVTFDSITSVMLNGSGGIRHQVNDAGTSTTTPGVNRQLVSYPPADTTVPTVGYTAAPATPDGADGWYVSPVTLAVTGTDDYTPGPWVQVAVDGGGWADAEGAITVSADGTHTVDMRAVDDSENVSTTANWEGKIDGTAPSVAPAVSGEEVSATASDATSGVVLLEASLGSDSVIGTWQPYTGPVEVTPGARVVRFRATDAAGNVSAIASATVPAAAAPSLTLSPAIVTAGGTLTVAGENVPAGIYTLVLHSEPVTLATVTVGPSGTLATTVTVPSSVSAGAHSLRLTSSGGAVLAAADVTVLADPRLAATGADAVAAASVGALLLALGAVALRVRRRREATVS